MYNVDLGYLTFKLAFGGYETWQAKHGHLVSIAAVDSKSRRKELYPAYKQYRNVGKDAVIQMVWELRRQVEQEQLLPLCSVEGLEADDLVACWNIFNPNDEIIGVDKDFFQLPNEPAIFYHNLKPFNIASFYDKLPDYVQPLARKNFALYQILLGDVADNIPRLLAKGRQGKEQVAEALVAIEYGTLGEWLLSTFGNAARINAGLILLPYFEYGQFNRFADWFDCWCNGHYYDQHNWVNLYSKMKSCIKPNRVKQDTETLQMFSLV